MWSILHLMFDCVHWWRTSAWTNSDFKCDSCHRKAMIP